MPKTKSNLIIPSRANSLIDALKASARHFSISELELQPLSEQHYLQTLDIKKQLAVLKEKSNEFTVSVKENNKELLTKLIQEITKISTELNVDIARIDCDGSADRLDSTESMIKPYKLLLDGLIEVATPLNLSTFVDHLKHTERDIIQIRNQKRFDVSNQTQLQWVKQQLESSTTHSKLKLGAFFLFILLAIVAVVVYFDLYHNLFVFEEVKPQYKKIVGPPVALKGLSKHQ